MRGELGEAVGAGTRSIVRVSVRGELEFVRGDTRGRRSPGNQWTGRHDDPGATVLGEGPLS